MPSFGTTFADGLGGDEVLTADPDDGDAPDHTTSALNRLLNQFQQQTNWEKILGTFGEQLQAVETSGQALKTLTSIDDSFGAQLDNVGDLVGEPRNGFDDVVYRLHIKARVALNKGSGTIPQILTMFNTLLNGVVELRLEEAAEVAGYRPPTIYLHTEHSAAIDPTLAPYLAKFLSQARAAGVQSFFVWATVPPAETFTFLGGVGEGFGTGVFVSARTS